MEPYAVDIDPKQIVRWIRDEDHATPDKFRIVAGRTSEHRAIPLDDARLGDEEREDLTEIATVATLEIAPVPASDGWVLTVTVEDEIGPRPAGGGMREIDITSFYDQFLRTGRGTASVGAEVDGAEGEARLNRLLDAAATNRHPAS
ncbi:hypothetical protein MZK49_22170 [Ensifer sesbaniae]|uniref:hypothetical protein n=1 Tax=Ensifer sesbaniae TaxID=1214071 RepID=UPI002001319A|nr:hypothetical protein [Ensifer sesbaniae]